MTDPDSPLRGAHELPLLFSSAPVAPTRPRRRRTGLVLGVVGALIVAGGLAAAQLGANLSYDDAAERYDAAVQTTRETIAEVRADTGDLQSATGFAYQLMQSDDGTLVDSASKDALAAAVSGAEAAASDAEDVLDSRIPEPGEKPAWFWELFAASDRLADDRDGLDDLADDLADETPAIDEAQTALSDAGLTLLTTAASTAAGFEAAHPSAKNDAVIALRDAAAKASAATGIDASAATSLASLQSAAALVVSSEQAELAEKAGPLLSKRLEIEAFARSLAPGVLLEFDWNPIVSGAGGSGSMGGLTTWWWDTPGRAVIELSNSVAERWPSYSSKSLVAHEVGHAISVKCEDMYDSSTQDSIEKWATAWAISMGYTDDANGVWAYGYPPQSYIDAATGCR
ncbi:hypothetical protein [Microbacterium sp. OVT16B]|uniref:hypothetical protein n=1 Tax=Microbacterium sp. OVT16B TaxID=2862682 RepID=UPI001CBAF411|nr:hypothetical protein [Microbacterium sp. OVT16B]